MAYFLSIYTIFIMWNTIEGYEFDPETGGLILKDKPQESDQNWREKWIIYLRVSSKKQLEEWDWLRTQLATCKQWAEENEVDILQVFEDWWVSWKVVTRRWLENAIDYLEAENQTYAKINYFICSELSRISRADNLVQALQVEQRILGTWAEIQTVTNSIDTSTDEWNMMKDIQYVFASYERKKNSKRTKNNMRWRMLDGYYVNSAPAWYEYKKDNEKVGKKSNSLLVWNEHAPAIQEWLKRFSKGEFATKKALWRFLDERWVRSNWRNGKTEWIRKLSHSFVDKLLQPHKLLLYAGYIVYPQWDIDEPIKAKHKPLITESEMRKINLRLANKNTKLVTVRDDAKPELPLRWLMRCWSCSAKLTWWNCKGKSWQKYPYYFCCNRECKKKIYVQTGIVHEQFQWVLKDMTAGQLEMDLFRVAFDNVEKKRQSWLWAIRKAKEKDLANLIIEKENIEEKLITISKPGLVKSLEEKREKVENSIESLNVELEDTSTDDTLSKYFEHTLALFENPVEIWDLGNKELRKLLINLMFDDSLIYKKNKGVWTLVSPLPMRANAMLCSKESTMGRTTGIEPATTSTTN